MVIIGISHAIVVFRVVAAPLMSESEWKFLEDYANIVVVLLGAVLHYITIQVMTRVCILVLWYLYWIYKDGINVFQLQFFQKSLSDF